MPVNILYIIDSLTHGGTEKQLVQLVRHLDPTHFRPYLCTLKPSEGLYDELQVSKICLNFESFLRPSIMKTILTLAGFIRRNEIGIVQTFFQDPFFLAALIKPFCRVKLVGSFRDLGFWRTAVETRKMRMAFPFFSGFIANSEAVKEHFVKTDGIAPDKIAVIYNGIDLPDAISNDVVNVAQDPAVIGILANLNRPVKRVQDFIQAAAIVHRQFEDARFVVIGDGHLRGELEVLAKQLGLGDTLTFTGRVTHPYEYLVNFSIGVITSETEGLCNAILEYMACGVPVVATRVDGNNEILTDGINGILYEVGDIEQLSGAIIRLLRNPDERLKISAVNRLASRERFSLESMVEQTVAVYGNLKLGPVA